MTTNMVIFLISSGLISILSLIQFLYILYQYWCGDDINKIRFFGFFGDRKYKKFSDFSVLFLVCFIPLLNVGVVAFAGIIFLLFTISDWVETVDCKIEKHRHEKNKIKHQKNMENHLVTKENVK